MRNLMSYVVAIACLSSLASVSTFAQSSTSGTSPTATPTDQMNPQTKTKPARVSAARGLPQDTATPAPSAGGNGRLTTQQTDALAQCNQSWDAGSHLTKKRWAELCRLNLANREDQRYFGTYNKR